jgi:ribosomal protein S18 acetylase RimI-like enzyme
MHILTRELTINDLEDYKMIRLELLKKHPTNFGSSEEEERLFSHDHWVKRLTNNNTRTIGTFVDGQIVGLAVLSVNPRKKMKHTGTIHSFYVKEQYRRKGLAKQMLDFLEELSIKEGLIRLNLSVVEVNEGAISFYKNNDFIETGKECDTLHYENQYYTLILMSKIMHKERV